MQPLPTFSKESSIAGESVGTNPKSPQDEDVSAYEVSSASGSQTGGIQAANASSFPVDVIVYFHMQGSVFRFNCAPVGRMECMLCLPSLDLVFSSKRPDDDGNEESKFTHQQGARGFSFDGSKVGDTIGENNSSTSNYSFGGLSVTGCLSDFNLYVFHPFGGGRKKPRPEDMVYSPLSSEERKDSLSVNVSVVQFHISR